MSPFRPREGQRQILEFQGGLMGVSAVPGSGKTSTIAALACRLIAEGRVGLGQVLVVTYQNAAVENIRSRIREQLDEMGLVQVGYDVRTLHSLSYGIIQTHPGLAGAAPEFQVVDERSSNNLLDKAVRIWNTQNEKVWGRLAPGDYYGEAWERDWRRIAHTVARTVVTAAKNQRLGPADLLERLEPEGKRPTLFCVSAPKSTNSTNSRSRPLAAWILTIWSGWRWICSTPIRMCAAVWPSAGRSF